MAAAGKAAKVLKKVPDAARVAKLKTFFARASVATRLLQSRLALPIAYPLNSAMLTETASPNKPPSGWKQEEVTRGLAHVTPIVTAMSKAAPLLKAAQALSHYQGGQQRHVVKDPETEEETDIRIDFLRPQRLRGSGFGRGPGHVVTKTGDRWGWEDMMSTEHQADSSHRRWNMDPYADTPSLHSDAGRKFKSPTKWDKRKSGSQ
mmetsp:Transcript_21329/g.47168  ORF Transcript_21329/g.47168 Transcript_21329/m.47168 type:complete len:205 (+) Transcript_21329:74-688(+)